MYERRPKVSQQKVMMEVDEPIIIKSANILQTKLSRDEEEMRDEEVGNEYEPSNIIRLKLLKIFRFQQNMKRKCKKQPRRQLNMMMYWLNLKYMHNIHYIVNL